MCVFFLIYGNVSFGKLFFSSLAELLIFQCVFCLARLLICFWFCPVSSI